MAEADPVTRPAGARSSPVTNNLLLRVVSAAILAPLAVFSAYVGGWFFALFWGAAALAVLWEWIALVRGRLWVIAGVAYAGTLWLSPVLLRADKAAGFTAIMMLFAIVWTTDVLGYFGGRAFGGPKLMPAVSPKKTWSGAICGTAGAVIAAVIVVSLMGTFDRIAIALIALILSVVSQTGDLMESWIKRKFDAKDAGSLIPGHGGVMDRLDGFWAAALLGCLIGVARGGLEGAARGLLAW